METVQIVMNGLRKCEIYIYIDIDRCNGILFSHKDEILSFTGKWMELENIMLSEVIQVQKNKGCVFSLIYNIYIYTHTYIQYVSRSRTVRGD
jgi:hypothetical protein